mgnify:CR=1 FL=1
MIERFLGWLGETPWSVALLESLYAWPLIETSHVLTLALFAGTAIMLDLRLTGLGFRDVPVSAFVDRVLPWTRAAFALMAITGLLLFYSDPLKYYQNLFFRVKATFLVVAGINIGFFHARTHRTIADWDDWPVPPRAVRIAGAVSLLAWSAIVVSGRLVAYNWFECEIQPQPAFVNWFAGCSSGGAP